MVFLGRSAPSTSRISVDSVSARRTATPRSRQILVRANEVDGPSQAITRRDIAAAVGVFFVAAVGEARASDTKKAPKGPKTSKKKNTGSSSSSSGPSGPSVTNSQEKLSESRERDEAFKERMARIRAGGDPTF